MKRTHSFNATVRWKGNHGEGTLSYGGYSRDHETIIEGKGALQGSSDAAFRGDPTKYSPEDLLVSSLSSCHMLWYLHLCAVKGVVVLEYIDRASGEMTENADGSGEFTIVTLRPRVLVRNKAMVEKARELHDDAHKMCFIARSVKFTVMHVPEIRWEGEATKQDDE